jgi:hypothetical protein
MAKQQPGNGKKPTPSTPSRPFLGPYFPGVYYGALQWGKMCKEFKESCYKEEVNAATG